MKSGKDLKSTFYLAVSILCSDMNSFKVIAYYNSSHRKNVALLRQHECVCMSHFLNKENVSTKAKEF